MFEFLIIHYTNLASAIFETRNELVFTNEQIKGVLDRFQRKRDRAAIRNGMLCEGIKSKDGKPCTSYKVGNTRYCQAHKRLDPTGDNHLFSSKFEEVKSPESDEFFDIDAERNKDILYDQDFMAIIKSLE
jgi:hypothetical protein